MKIPILISYPRSGSNFLFYCIKNIFGLNVGKTHCQNKEFWTDSGEFRCVYNIGKNNTQDKPFFVKKNSPVLFMIRNYKECIPRQTREYFFGKNYISALSNKMTKDENHHFDYIAPLYFYDKFKDEKILIYYEDLMNNTEEKIIEVCDFIKNKCGIDYKESDLNDFIKNIDYHKSMSVEIYKKHSPSLTEGKDVLYHSKKMDIEEIKKVDTYIIKKYNRLLKKYLKRYLL